MQASSSGRSPLPVTPPDTPSQPSRRHSFDWSRKDATGQGAAEPGAVSTARRLHFSSPVHPLRSGSHHHHRPHLPGPDGPEPPGPRRQGATPGGRRSAAEVQWTAPREVAAPGPADAPVPPGPADALLVVVHPCSAGGGQRGQREAFRSWVVYHQAAEIFRTRVFLAWKYAALTLLRRVVRVWASAMLESALKIERDILAIHHWAQSKQRQHLQGWHDAVRIGSAHQAGRTRVRFLRVQSVWQHWRDVTTVLTAPFGSLVTKRAMLAKREAVDGWTAFRHASVRRKLANVRAFQHRQHAITIVCMNDWLVMLTRRRRDTLSMQLAHIRRLQRYWGLWAAIAGSKKQLDGQRIGKVLHLRTKKMMDGWRAVTRDRVSLRMVSAWRARKLNARCTAAWKSFADSSIENRLRNEMVVLAALQRLGRKAVLAWCSWHEWKASLLEKGAAAAQVRDYYLVSTFLHRWTAYCAGTREKYAKLRRAQRHARGQQLASAFASWLEFLDVLDAQYASRRRALLHHQRAAAKMAFRRWLSVMRFAARRRQQCVTAASHFANAAVSKAWERWREHSQIVRLETASTASAVQHRHSHVLRASFHIITVYAEQHRTLTWAKHERVASLQSVLAHGRLRRLLLEWSRVLRVARNSRCLKRCADALARRKRLFAAMAAMKHHVCHRNMHRCRNDAAVQAHSMRFLRAGFWDWGTWVTAHRLQTARVNKARACSARMCVSRAWAGMVLYLSRCREKRSEEREALGLYSSRLISDGCRAWLCAGMSLGAARMEGAIQSEFDRTQAQLKLAERYGRRWLNIVLANQRFRGPPRSTASDLAFNGLSRASYRKPYTAGAGAVVPPQLGPVVTEQSATTRPAARFQRPVPRRPAMLFEQRAPSASAESLSAGKEDRPFSSLLASSEARSLGVVPMGYRHQQPEQQPLKADHWPTRDSRLAVGPSAAPSAMSPAQQLHQQPSQPHQGCRVLAAAAENQTHSAASTAPPALLRSAPPPGASALTAGDGAAPQSHERVLTVPTPKPPTAMHAAAVDGSRPGAEVIGRKEALPVPPHAAVREQQRRNEAPPPGPPEGGAGAAAVASAKQSRTTAEVGGMESVLSQFQLLKAERRVLGAKQDNYRSRIAGWSGDRAGRQWQQLSQKM